MARRKNAPDLVKVKCSVSERLREIRLERFGERGGPELARQLGLPVRTWYNYEAGVTVPAEVVLKLIELTSVEASWLLNGVEPKFRDGSTAGRAASPSGAASVVSLLRSALQRLERGEIPLREMAQSQRELSNHDIDQIGTGNDSNLVLVHVENSDHEPLTLDAGPRFIAARREWHAAESDHRCLLVSDDAMAPLVSPGAYVAYSARDGSTEGLDGKLVVAWISDEPPIVRWFQNAGRLALLRSENPQANPLNRLIEIDEPAAPCRFRVVSWISTPR